MAKTDTKQISQKELKRRDFILNGNLWKVVALLALPLFFYSIFNYVYSIIDTIMCSGIGKEAVNAVAPLNQVTNMISALGGGLSAGGSILIAREIGRGNYPKAKRLASTVFTLAFLFSILTVAIVVPLHIPLLRAFGITEESIAIGKNYFILSAITHAIIMVDTVYLGVEKAKGSTLSVTLLNLGVVIIKVIFNVIFLYGFHIKDMMFVSLATLIANACLFTFVIIRLISRNYLFHYSFKNLDFSKYNVSKITFISFPIFLGKFIFSLGKVVINGLTKSFGNDVVGALGVSNNMGGSVTNPLSSIEDSTSTIISTNLGAGHVKRAIKTFYIGLVYNLAIAVIGVILVTVFDSQITHFFARNAGSPEEIEAFAQNISNVFFYEKMGIITLAFNSCVLGMLYGFGYTKLSMIINISRVFVFRIPSFLICKYLIPGLSGYQVAGISMGASNILIGIVALVTAIILIYRIKKKTKIKEGAKMLNKEQKADLISFFKEYLGNFKHYKNSEAFCYEDGVILRGAYSLYKTTHDKFFFDWCLKYYEDNISEDGEMKIFDIQSIDDIQPGFTLFMVNAQHHEEKFDKALMKLSEKLQGLPRTKVSNSFWHKARYPEQIWLDGLYMGQPFYAEISSDSHYGDGKKMREDIINQFENVKKFNKAEDGLYYHCYDEARVMQWADKDTGRSPNVWLRSVGWLAMASVDVADIFESNGHPVDSKKIQSYLVDCLESMDKLEDPEMHMWKDLPAIETEGNYFETSGTLMFAYARMKGARLGYLPYEEMKKGVEEFDSVYKHYFKNHHLGNICKVSGLDNERRNGSVEYYLSEPICDDDAKGVGPFMMAYSEYIALSY